MVVSNRFRLLLVAALAITVLPKLMKSGAISNPASSEVLRAVSSLLSRKGYQVVDNVAFAGQPSLMARNGDCLLYLMSVAHQGWNQAVIQKSVSPSQTIWFAFEGALFEGRQAIIRPLILYYFRKLTRYIGFSSAYPPVIAIVAEGKCAVSSIDWKSMVPIPFEDHSVFGQ